MHLRRTLTVVPLVLAVLAAPSLAAPKAKPVPPQIVDPKGDSLGGQAGFDILSVEYKTSGLGSGKAYVPKKLIVTLTLAGPPRTEGLVAYTMRAETDTCGRFIVKYTPGTAVSGLIGDTYATFGSCAEGMFFPAKVKGSVVTFEFGLKATGIDRGTEVSDFIATVDLSDPALGSFGSDIVSPGLLDKASGKGTWLVP